MRYKVSALSLIIFMLLGMATPAAAGSTELFDNGGMEAVQDGIIESWGFGGGDAKTQREISTTIKHGGTNAVRLLDTGEKNIYLIQTVKVVPGTTYKLSGYVYPLDLGQGYVHVKVEMYKYVDEKRTYVDKLEVRFPDLILKRWQQISADIPLGKEISEVNVLYRMEKCREVYFDDLSFTGEKPDPPAPLANAAYKEMPAGSEELLSNAGYEEVDSATGAAIGWEAIGGWENESKYTSITSEAAFEGKNAVQIKTGSGNNPWARQLVYHEFKKGEVYQCSAWVRIKSGTFVLKLEWHDKDDKFTGGYSTDQLTLVTGEQWVQYVYNLTVPVNCSRITFYVRGFGAANLLADNVSFYKISDAPRVSISTDEVFYYTEEAKGIAKGTASAEVYTEQYPELTDATVDFQLLDGEDVLYEEKALPQKEHRAEFSYKLSLLKEETRAYTVKAMLKDKDGNAFCEVSHPIYKYPRPEVLNEKGQFVIDGKPFRPVLYYHVRPEQYALVKAIGGNVVQSNTETPDGILDRLNKAQEAGIMVMASMYLNMKPAGHPDNVQNTKDIIEAVKNHPALLGYMVMDEPGQHFPGQYNLFEDSYKLIRDLDPKHVVYICEDTLGNYADYQKYVDVLSIDPYPSTYKGSTVELVSQRNLAATAATKYQKPVLSVNQLHKNGDYCPNEAEIRNMMYQAMFGGASALGYFAFYAAIDGKDLDKTEQYERVKTLFEDGELEKAQDIFIDRKYPVFFEKYTQDAWQGAYIMDNALYVILASNKTEDAPCTVPLVSDGGTVKLDAFTAELIYGGSGTVTGSGTLECTLPAQGAYVYKVTPQIAVDFSSVKKTDYRDTFLTPWAAEQIRTLEEKGIVNDVTAISFAPTAKITRADFAYFYVRTLGLTADSTENFADVDADAYYAKELAAGRALGILNGIGDNKYDPEAEISRQDLMTIIARGMKLSGGDGDLSAFSDQNLIAEYAKDGVRAMVATGLVKGNADGTLNPLGNATRAEAAVIMNRILER